MMCLADSIPSFVGKVYYSLDAPSFCLPEITSGIDRQRDLLFNV